MKNKRPFQVIFVICIAMLTGIVFLVDRQSNAPKQGAKRMQYAQAKLPQNIQDETTNWNTYTNSEQGFEIKYPSEFRPDENSDYPNSGDVIVAFRRPSYGDWTFSVAGAYRDSQSGISQTFLEAVKNYPFRDENNFQEKMISVAGKSAQEFSFIDKHDRNIEKVSVYIPKNDGGYFYIDWKASEDISADQKVQNTKEQFYAILSTFKFLNRQPR